MINTGRSLSRRTLLRGIGVSLALPMLDAMRPALAAPAPAAKPPCRMLFNYLPNGIIMNDWTPAETGSQFTLKRTLEPLAAHREKMLVISGLAQYHGNSNGDGPGDHARAAASYLTGVHVKKTGGADIEVGISADQVAAQHLAKKTRFASLELACEDGRMVGVCDPPYTCVYNNHISWRSATTPNSPEVNPRAVFERLFGSGDENPEARARTRAYDQSILDWVLEDSHKLKSRLGPSDQRKIDEYMTAVREIELRLERAEKQNLELRPTIEKPDATPVELRDHTRIMYELLRVGFQSDTTRVATFMIGREGSVRTYREIGISDSHHPMTHHKGDSALIEKVAKINRYHAELFAEFVAKLAATPDGDGTLLDHSMIVYGGGIADGNRHQHEELPTVLVGGACGTVKSGRHIRVKEKTPINNLYVSMLDRMGVRIEKLGDSTGQVRELSEIG